MPCGSTTAVAANRCPPVWLVLHTLTCSPSRPGSACSSWASDVPSDPQQRSRLPCVQTRTSVVSSPLGCSSRIAERGVDDFAGADLKLRPLEPCAPVGRPPVGDDMARAVRRGRRQPLKAHPGIPGESHHRCKIRIVAQVPRPGKGPFDQQVAPIAAGCADRIETLVASPVRAKHTGAVNGRVLRSDAGGHWRGPYPRRDSS